MPKSKKNKIVHLTQVKKKSKDHKEDLIKLLEQYVTKYKRVYIFDFELAKSDRIMNLRLLLKEYGNIFSGKNSLVSLTLKTIGSRTNRNYDNLIQQVAGHRGLFFTDIKKDKLVDLLNERQPEFCKKLLGYADLVPGGSAKSKLKSTSLDSIELNPEAKEAHEGGESRSKTKNKKREKQRDDRSEKRDKDLAQERDEVKFVKI